MPFCVYVCMYTYMYCACESPSRCIHGEGEKRSREGRERENKINHVLQEKH